MKPVHTSVNTRMINGMSSWAEQRIRVHGRAVLFEWTALANTCGSHSCMQLGVGLKAGHTQSPEREGSPQSSTGRSGTAAGCSRAQMPTGWQCS